MVLSRIFRFWPWTKKEGGVKSIPEGEECNYSSEGVLILARRGGAPSPLSTCVMHSMHRGS